MRTRIKFCGITRVEDALMAARLGADAVGLIFTARSPRQVAIEVAREIALALPPLVTRVGLFMDNNATEVAAALHDVPLDLLQFHGSEDADFCRVFAKPYLKAVPMMDVADVAAYAAWFPDATGFVLDSHRAGGAGGTGQAFDWARAPQGLTRPLLIAGGLGPHNVARAIQAARPWAVDVSSGVESAPGIKDHAKMRSFIDEVHRAGTRAGPG